MIKKFVFLLAGFAASFGPCQMAIARDPSCAHLAGSLVFIDTLYGIGLGTLVSGLWVVAADQKRNVEQQLATGALAGGALGLGFGIYEVASRDCKLIIGRADHRPELPAISYDPLASRWTFSLRYQF